MEGFAIQDKLPELAAQCWGCGKNNHKGLRIKSYYQGDECICIFHPQPHHIAYTGIGCGGIIATILDCHCINTAIYTAYMKENREVGTKPDIIYATASLTINFLKPAPINQPWVFKARVSEFTQRRINVECQVFTNDVEFANGSIIAAYLKSS